MESSSKKKVNFSVKNPTNYTWKNTRDTPKATYRPQKITNAMVINSKESELDESSGKELKKNGYEMEQILKEFK